MKYQLFPLGYRCSSAGILKQLQLKTESYPFDWLVSRLPVIQHCLETNFQYFIEDISNNYAQYKTITQHYEFDGTTTFICDETWLPIHIMLKCPFTRFITHNLSNRRAIHMPSPS